jgi:hypothetical protein
VSRLAFRNLPLNTLPSELAEYLWSTVGLGVDVDDIKVLNFGKFSATAFVNIRNITMVEFLTRNLCDKPFFDRTIGVEKEDTRRAPKTA